MGFPVTVKIINSLWHTLHTGHVSKDSTHCLLTAPRSRTITVFHFPEEEAQTQTGHWLLKGTQLLSGWPGTGLQVTLVMLKALQNQGQELILTATLARSLCSQQAL